MFKFAPTTTGAAGAWSSRVAMAVVPLGNTDQGETWSDDATPEDPTFELPVKGGLDISIPNIRDRIQIDRIVLWVKRSRQIDVADRPLGHWGITLVQDTFKNNQRVPMYRISTDLLKPKRLSEHSIQVVFESLGRINWNPRDNKDYLKSPTMACEYKVFAVQPVLLGERLSLSRLIEIIGNAGLLRVRSHGHGSGCRSWASAVLKTLEQTGYVNRTTPLPGRRSENVDNALMSIGIDAADKGCAVPTDAIWKESTVQRYYQAVREYETQKHIAQQGIGPQMLPSQKRHPQT
ncbi:hypothetical protein K435DRAFT_869354 [Dendrothele bispora CBS 962.96]|uniref:DUF7770 domain-containing protein n=1 Tax=Dendrothele bispora (strain CBS 962.96) TaxID=1314807 RepID=A0A4S8L9B4_DENBC|nr:hypothetical protein K435DRAFT_869354 [Dendrothele bispora CBS 962.96]